MLSCVNLIQPWADAVVDGLIPVLVRSQCIKKRGKIGIKSTNGMDGVFLATMDERDLDIAEDKLVFNKVIGTVDVVDCISLSQSEVWATLERKLKNNLYEFYPTHLIPNSHTVYMWLLENPARFLHPLDVASSGITWSKAACNNEAVTVNGVRTFWDSVSSKNYIKYNVEGRENHQLSFIFDADED